MLYIYIYILNEKRHVTEHLLSARPCFENKIELLALESLSSSMMI